MESAGLHKKETQVGIPLLMNMTNIPTVPKWIVFGSENYVTIYEYQPNNWLVKESKKQGQVYCKDPDF